MKGEYIPRGQDPLLGRTVHWTDPQSGEFCTGIVAQVLQNGAVVVRCDPDLYYGAKAALYIEELLIDLSDIEGIEE